MIDLVTKEFDYYVRKVCRDIQIEDRETFIQALLNHERKPVCIDSLCAAIRQAESRANIGGKFNIARFRMFIEATAGLFCSAALEQMHQRALSISEKHRQVDEANRIKEAEEEFASEQAELMDTRVKSYPTTSGVNS